MARAFFTRPVEIDGVYFAGGREHIVPPVLREHWFFKALLKDGAAKITEDDAPAVVNVDTPAEQAAKPTVEKPANPEKTGKATRKRKGA